MENKTGEKKKSDVLLDILSKSSFSDSQIARGISVIENFDEEDGVLQKILSDYTREKSIKLGITGSPGVGKSTFINTFISKIDVEAIRTAIIAVDPSSRKNNGAILGDRIRIANQVDSGSLFFRSMANRGHYGGLAKNIDEVVRFLEICGFSLILIETVGVGQNEVDIDSIADIVILLLDSNVGDGVQLEKSGIMEIGHILFVNREDRGINGNFLVALKGMVESQVDRDAVPRKVLTGSALGNTRVPEVIDFISEITGINLPMRRVE